MRVLIAGAGVIGTVYGAHLAGAWHAVSVLSHPPRTEDVARNGLMARVVPEGSRTDARVSVAPDAAGTLFDLVLVAVRCDQLAAACSQLPGLAGSPAVFFFGTTRGGRAIGGQVHGDVMLGSPGVGGVMRDGTAEYVRIPQQPAALQAGTDTRLDQLARALGTRGFAVQRVADMDGWLAYHAASVACVVAALYRCGTAWRPTARPSGSCAQPSPRLLRSHERNAAKSRSPWRLSRGTRQTRNHARCRASGASDDG